MAPAKTTMLRMMAGLLRPSRGDISVSGLGWAEQNGSAIGVVGHGEWIYDDLSAQENLEFFGVSTKSTILPRASIGG